QHLIITSKMEYITTNKSRRELIHNGYRYQLERTTNEKTIWKCALHYKVRCPGRVHVVDGLVEVRSDHGHAPDIGMVKARQIVNEDLKDRAATTTEPPSRIVAEVIATTSQATKGSL